jgi:4,5-DOPA dioxygenase extradiol
MTDNPTQPRMPALFLAHGNPMNALADNSFTRSLTELAADLPRPEAVLVVSAHWLTRGTHVLSSAEPRTIHDFGGFPDELYRVQYPALGSPQHAEAVCDLVPEAIADNTWGLDHASWSLLRHMWPDADVPVFELSLDADAPAETHWEIGRRLASLRDNGVLVVGSGNIVHSFAGISWEPDAPARPWAEEFDAWIADAILRRDQNALVDYESAGAIARLSMPTNDHYLPLLYAAAMSDERDAVSFTHTGVEMGSVSMRCVRFG